MELRNIIEGSYTALPFIVNMIHEWLRVTAKYRCTCEMRYQYVLSYNAYGYRCTECDLPTDPRGLLWTFADNIIPE